MFHNLSVQLLTLGEKIHFYARFDDSLNRVSLNYALFLAMQREWFWRAFTRLATDTDFFFAVFVNSKKYSIKYIVEYLVSLIAKLMKSFGDIYHSSCTLN